MNQRDISVSAAPLTNTILVCPLCSSKDSTVFDARNFRGQTVKNRLCSNCGLVYQSPRMPDDVLAAFYEEEYRQLYQGNQEPSPRDLAVQRLRTQSLLGFCHGRLSPVKRHLDIGCSAGLLLQGFQSAYNCQPVGIEPGTAYREYATSQGLEVHPSLDNLPGDNQYDLISLAHVLEHLPDPVNYLAALREKWLSHDGQLLVEVPNLYGHDCFEVAHLVSYSPTTLQQTLSRAGYSIVKVEVHGRPRSKVIPLYITVLTSPSEKPLPEIQAEHGVRQKRQMGMLHRQLVTLLIPQKAWLPIS